MTSHARAKRWCVSLSVLWLSTSLPVMLMASVPHVTSIVLPSREHQGHVTILHGHRIRQASASVGNLGKCATHYARQIGRLNVQRAAAQALPA